MEELRKIELCQCVQESQVNTCLELNNERTATAHKDFASESLLMT